MKLGRLNQILPGTGRGTARVASGGGGPPTGLHDGWEVSPLRHAYAFGYGVPPPRSGEDFRN